ncbi:hypothetical protein [Gordonia sp. SID5947]|uniref:hypothetical protein n=1 Tax=Gordonia sp. SID5947 TaxID=2690315 RepID=UPI001F488C1D|nr:hypothetical protein [Gordonia sp. SID5947]
MINTLIDRPPTVCTDAVVPHSVHHGPTSPPAVRKLLAALLVGGTLTGATLVAAPAGAIEQGGADPDGPSQSGPMQGGVDPEGPQAPSAPAPAPQPQPEAPSYTPGPGPGVIPAPPQEAPYQPYEPPTYYSEPNYSQPNYDTTYTPTPSRPYTLPRPTAPVRPIAPPPKTLRVGNVVVKEEQLKRDAPWLSDRQRNSINDWAAYGESKIAQGLISVGVPEDEASRQAAATIIGVVLGGTTGAAAVGIPAAVVGGIGER